MPDVHQLSRERAEVDLVDEHGDSIGQDSVASAHTAPGTLHRAFSVMLVDDHERVLIQQRALSKVRFPGVWAPSCCGHPLSASNLETQAAQRTQEELGLTATDLRVIGHTTYFITSHGDQVEHEYNHVLIGRCTGEPRPDPSEVATTCWIPISQLQAELDSGEQSDRTYGEWLPPVLDVLTAWLASTRSPRRRGE